eukprot:6202683-Pleurochrysis_carterae.AAC.3
MPSPTGASASAPAPRATGSEASQRASSARASSAGTRQAARRHAVEAAMELDWGRWHSCVVGCADLEPPREQHRVRLPSEATDVAPAMSAKHALRAALSLYEREERASATKRRGRSEETDQVAHSQRLSLTLSIWAPKAERSRAWRCAHATYGAPARFQFRRKPGVSARSVQLGLMSPVQTVAPSRAIPGEKARLREKKRRRGAKRESARRSATFHQ